MANKIVIITGLTASGKSGLAVKLAKQFNGEVVSCDSVQIFKGLDIGSAKITSQEMQGIKHHLIDICSPFDDFSVSDFVLRCEQAILDIISRGKLPILVGGTGLYIKALVEGYSFNNINKNEEFRQDLQEQAKLHGNMYVWNKLNEKDSELASKVHFNNLKRVIRYLEIATFGKSENNPSILNDYEYILVGLVGDREQIYQKINYRVDEMLNMGLESEVKGLINQGLTLSNNCMNTIGYREMYEYLTNQISYEKCVELIKQHTRNYCKRQLTFMKTIPNIKLLDIEQAEKEIKEFLK